MKILAGRIISIVREHQILAAILGVGFLLRVSGIFWGVPFPDAFEGKYHPDEGQIIQGAVEFPGHVLTNTYFVYPTFFHYFLGVITLPLRIFFDEFGVPGPGEIGSNFYYVVTVIGRLWSVLFGMGAIIFTYFLAKDIFDQKRALLASALLTFTLYHATNSGFATTDVLTSFLLVSFLYFLRYAFKSPEAPFLFVCSGMILGLLIGTKYTGAIASLAIVVIYTHMVVKQSRGSTMGAVCNLRKLHFHLLLCGSAAIATFFFTTPGILIHFNGFTESMLWNFRYVERYSLPRFDLMTWEAIWQKIGVAVGIPLASMFIFGLFFPFKKNVFEISLIVIVVAYFVYFENRLLSRYVILVAPLVSIIASNGAIWLYDSRKMPVRVFGRSMITIVLVYSLAYCVTGAYLRYNDTRTQAGHFVHERFPQGTTLGVAYFSEKFGWTTHSWRYPQIDYTWFRSMDFLEYPEVVVVSSEYDTTKIEEALKSEKLSGDYLWDEQYNKDWYQFSPPSPRVFRFYDELNDSERSQYILLKTFKKQNIVPVEFGAPEIRIFLHRSYSPKMVGKMLAPSNTPVFVSRENSFLHHVSLP